MKFKPLHPTPALSIEDNETLATQLRRVACEVERREISQIILTVLRPDGTLERIGNVPDASRLH